MNSYKYKIFAAIFICIALFSCEKDEDRITFKGGVAPVLSISTNEDDIVLEKSNEKYQSLQFHWTNPQYEFSNGANTQDVQYFLEIDTTGSDFSNPKRATLSFTKGLMTSFTVKDLNNTLSGLELSDYEPHNFEFRIKSTLSNGSVPLYSNVIKKTVTTYLDVIYPVPDQLFITGAATEKGWMSGGDAPVAEQQFTKVNAYTFVIESIVIKAGEEFLFVPVYGNWDNKYGFTGAGAANNVNGDTFQPAGNNFKAPGTTKAYKITVNFKTGKYAFE